MAKVVVAMSGGLDSSVAAALLKKAGFEVIGVFMKLADLPKFRESEKRAKKIAKILKIPFLVSDLRKEFKKRIVDYFLEGHKKGITPNPCVVCNKEIKFGLLLEKALALDADFIATGHYAKKKEELNFSTGVEKVNYKLLKGGDKNKDQSYFLWMLNQEQLKRVLFPIGDYTREEVKKLAKKFKLPVLKARKSVEICFIKTTLGEEDKSSSSPFAKARVNDFLSKYLKSKPGQIVDVRGKVLGKHRGLHFYTIGQRKGIGLPGGPYYVLNKDLKKNLLIVTKNEKDLYKKELIAKNVNWISGKEPHLRQGFGGQVKFPLKIKAKIRYRHQSALAVITKTLNPKTYTLKFEKSQRAITPGQSVVFYRGEELLGGGIIC